MVFQQDIPKGYKKGSPGWSLVVTTSKDRKLSKLKSENDELKQRLEQLEVIVGELASKKKK